MNAQELWNEYKQINPSIGDDIDAWQFGVEPDLLAQLVLDGTKTATASAYDLYAVDNDPLPEVGSYDVVLDSKDQAVCIIQIKKVSVVAFDEVSEEHAFKEGEGDRSLEYWRKVHSNFVAKELASVNILFDEHSKVVCEEFEVVYPKG